MAAEGRWQGQLVHDRHGLPQGIVAVAQLEPFVDAGYTHVALVQIGGETQPEFVEWAQAELLPALRALSTAA